MKKLFFMIVGMVTALCVQAQGKFALTEGDTFKSTDQVTSVPGITLTFGGEGGADFKAAKADTNVDGYTAYTEGNGTNGESEGGTYYVFAPEETGLVSAAFALKGDAKLFVEEDGKVLTNFNGISCKTDYANVFDICVKAGKTYKVYSSESELGFYGFEYKVAQNLTTIANDYIKSHSSSAEYQIELEPGGVYYMSGPIVSDKGIIILGNAKNNPIVDASAVTSSIIRMSTTPAVAYVDGKRYEIDNVVLKNINFKGVYQYIYDDQKIVYGVNNFIIEGCQFELTNTKQDIDCPFRFQAGGPVKFSMKNNTMYQTGTYTYKYVVKTDNNWPDKQFATFTGPYVWEIENNTIVGVANTGQFMNGGRTSNVYKKTSLSIKNNIFIDCVKANSSNFWQKVFGGKTGDNLKDFVYLSTVSNTYITNGEDVSSCTVSYDKGTKLTSKPLFAFPAKGDFTIGEGCQQYESLAGASKWLKNYAGGMIDIVPESGSDLTKLLYESYAENNNPGAIQITLAKDGKYIVSGSLYIGCPLTILGAEGAVIDASANKNPFILMRPMPEVGLNDFGAYEISTVEIKDVKITGLKNRLFYADRQNYLFGKIVVENSIIQLDGSTPRSIFDFYCGGNFKELSILNSTLSADPSNAMRGGLVSTQSSKSIIEMGGTEQKISIKNSTLYNIAYGKTPVVLQRHSQHYLSFELKNSVIVNSGEAGKFALGLNEGQESNQPKWLVETNTFTFDGEDSGAEETIAKATVTGPVSFSDAANNDFTLNILSDAFNAGIGDPRWLVPAEGSVVVEPASGDVGAAVAAATEGKTVKELLVKLAKDGQYTTTKPIVTGGALVLRGNGATIDASELNDNMIAMAAVENPTEWTEGNIIITDLTVKGLKKALFYSTNKKYVAKDFIINNSVIEQAGDATTIDYTKGGTALNLVLSNSTFYAPTATTKAFYSSQGGEKATEYAEDAEQSFTILASTFYNLATGKNFFTHRQSNQKWLAFNLQNNIFVNCGKSGQVVKGVNGGQSGENPKWMIVNNLFNHDGKDTSAAEDTGDADEPVEKSIQGVVTFADAAAGDFNATITLAEGAEKPASAGDGYHWKVEYSEATGIEAVKTAGETSLENAVIYNLNGQRVEKPAKGLYIVNGKKVVMK